MTFNTDLRSDLLEETDVNKCTSCVPLYWLKSFKRKLKISISRINFFWVYVVLAGDNYFDVKFNICQFFVVQQDVHELSAIWWGCTAMKQLDNRIYHLK